MNVLKYLIILSGFLIFSFQSQGNDSGNQNTEISKPVISEPVVKTEEQPLYLFILDYINENKSEKCKNPEELAKWYYEIGTKYNVDPDECLPLAFIAHFHPESQFWMGDVGGAGELGTPQIAPCHRGPMKKSGLDWKNSERDRIEWAGIMISTTMKKGHNMYRAFRPWTTRDKGNGAGPAGWPEYKRLKKLYKEKYEPSKSN